MEDGIHWAFRNAYFTVNTLVCVDVEHFRAFMETFYRAGGRASGIFAANALLSNNVSQGILLFDDLLVPICCSGLETKSGQEI